MLQAGQQPRIDRLLLIEMEKRDTGVGAQHIVARERQAPEFRSPTSSAVNRATPNAPPFPMGQAVQPVLEAMGGNALAVLLTQKLLGAKQF